MIDVCETTPASLSERPVNVLRERGRAGVREPAIQQLRGLPPLHPPPHPRPRLPVVRVRAERLRAAPRHLEDVEGGAPTRLVAGVAQVRVGRLVPELGAVGAYGRAGAGAGRTLRRRPGERELAPGVGPGGGPDAGLPGGGTSNSSPQ